jgi:hypothetical protein
MRATTGPCVLLSALLLAACGAPTEPAPDGAAPDASAFDGGSGGDGGGGSDARADVPGLDAPADATPPGMDVPPAMDAPRTDAPLPDAGPVTAAELLALTTSCARIAGSPLYSTDEGLPATIPLCQLTNAIFWQADMDIDCDGGQTALCRSDPDYQPDTSAQTSTGMALDASTLPFVVIPLPRTGFDYSTHGIALGSVVAVVYRNQVVYGIFGDEGPNTIIGEASYALATLLGVDADPVTGGVDSGVTYIVFTGPSGVVTRNEDHAEAVRIGEARASLLARGM